MFLIKVIIKLCTSKVRLWWWNGCEKLDKFCSRGLDIQSCQVRGERPTVRNFVGS